MIQSRDYMKLIETVSFEKLLYLRTPYFHRGIEDNGRTVLLYILCVGVGKSVTSLFVFPLHHGYRIPNVINHNKKR